MSFLFRRSADHEAEPEGFSAASHSKRYGMGGRGAVASEHRSTRSKLAAAFRPIAICTAALVGIVASVGSLDMEGPTVTATGVGSPQAATLASGAPVGPIRIHGTSSEADTSMTMSISFAMTWDGGSSFGNPPPDIPVVEATITALSPAGEPSGTGFRAITMTESDPLVVEVDSACPASGSGCAADFDLTLQRVERNPEGTVQVTWTPTAEVSTTETPTVNVTVTP